MSFSASIPEDRDDSRSYPSMLLRAAEATCRKKLSGIRAERLRQRVQRQLEQGLKIFDAAFARTASTFALAEMSKQLGSDDLICAPLDWLHRTAWNRALTLKRHEVLLRRAAEACGFRFWRSAGVTLLSNWVRQRLVCRLVQFGASIPVAEEASDFALTQLSKQAESDDLVRAPWVWLELCQSSSDQAIALTRFKDLLRRAAEHAFGENLAGIEDERLLQRLQDRLVATFHSFDAFIAEEAGTFALEQLFLQAKSSVDLHYPWCWLRIAARYRAIRLRKRDRRGREIVEYLAERDSLRDPDGQKYYPGRRYEEQLPEHKLIEDELRKEVARLPQRLRFVTARSMAGMSVQETAEELGTSASTVRRDLAEANELLRERLTRQL